VQAGHEPLGMTPIVLGDRWFGSKQEVRKALKWVRETGPCPRDLTKVEMAWILPLVFKHSHATLMLHGWDGSPLRVDIRESYGGCFVRCFKFRAMDCSCNYISMSDCLCGTVGNVQAVRLANTMMEEICRAFVDAADEVCRA